MRIPALFKEYIWLIETINRAGRITLVYKTTKALAGAFVVHYASVLH